MYAVKLASPVKILKLYNIFMPLYLFEYYDDKNERHEFKDFYDVGTDFSAILSPCGCFKAQKII